MASSSSSEISFDASKHALHAPLCDIFSNIERKVPFVDQGLAILDLIKCIDFDVARGNVVRLVRPADFEQNVAASTFILGDGKTPGVPEETLSDGVSWRGC